jgi:drug/metabolite transporter (DMT)-like permease
VSADALATALILASALMHEAVNALVKVSADGLLTRGMMNATAFAAAVPLVPFVAPPEAGLWPILVLAVLIHGAYPFLLVAAYRHGDLSVAFPVARGVVPLGVAGLTLAAPELAPRAATLPFLALISAGVASFALERLSFRDPRHRRGLALAVLAGLIVAGYTVVDGVGLRAAGSPATYIVWLLLLDGLFVSTLIALVRRRALASFARRHWRTSLGAGLLGVASYGLALVALALANVAEIAALRETSIVFAALIGAFVLGERFGPVRLAGTALVVIGALGMRLVSAPH